LSHLNLLTDKPARYADLSVRAYGQKMKLVFQRYFYQ